MTESEIQDSILLALGGLPHVRLHRQNSGHVLAVPPKFAPALLRARIPAHGLRLAPEGAADLCGVIQEPCASCGTLVGRALQVEVKTPQGRLTPAQEIYHRVYRGLGALVITARSPEEALAALCPPTKSP